MIRRCVLALTVLACRLPFLGLPFLGLLFLGLSLLGVVNPVPRAWAAPGPFQAAQLPPTHLSGAIALLPAIRPGAIGAPAPIASPAGNDCRAAIAQAERTANMPRQLMAAIARIESGRYDPATHRTDPWPWTINAAGEPGVFATKAQAIAAVRAKQAAGINSIDVGCMQVNLLHHPNAFASLEQAFDPLANAAYAALFLTQLHAQTGEWTSATARYHSATPERGAAYQRKVAAIWPEELTRANLSANGATPTAGAIFAPRQGQVGPAATAFLPPAMSDHARVIPLASLGGGASPGRGLDAYRAMPVGIASRPRG